MENNPWKAMNILIRCNDKSSGGVGKQWMSRGFEWEEVVVVCGKMWW